MEKIGFIGGGNMARAIIGGLVQVMPASSVHVTDHHAEKREGLSRDFGVVAHDSTGSWVTGMDLVVLAVKPQTMKAACAELVPWLNRKGAALSIAAGIESDTICNWLWGYPVMRAMRQGLPFYYLPDMDNGRRNSIFVPFFGQQAATVPMVSRLSKVMKAKVLWCIATMTEEGYEVEITPPIENFPTADARADTCRLNAELEAWIRKHPDQYLWVHRRFKTRPEGEPSVY